MLPPVMTIIKSGSRNGTCFPVLLCSRTSLFISKDVWPLLISIFAAHLQHAHANGLFNNGLHFEEVKRVCGQEQNVQLVR